MARANQYYEVARLFLQERLSAVEIAEIMPITREQVYPFLKQAVDLGYVRLTPPISQLLSRKIGKGFGVDHTKIHVVDVMGPLAYPEEIRNDPKSVIARDVGYYGRAVAAVAADRVLELILQVGGTLWSRRPPVPVPIGLGPGRAGVDFSRSLAAAIRKSDRKVLMKLVAISASGPAKYPQFSPSSFFILFPDHIADHSVGLFAAPLVGQGQFNKMLSKPPPGFRESLEEKPNIRIIVTSMGDLRDPHDLLRHQLIAAGTPVDERIKNDGWLANVQYRPFREDGWIHAKGEEPRVPTLFELQEFVELRQKVDHHVILLARQCSLCHRDRGEALYPLMKESMRVWSEIVMDTETARTLLRLLRDRTGWEMTDEEAFRD